MAEAVSQPTRRKCALSIAIPSSIVSDVPHLREKTNKIGILARGAAIFRIEEIVIYLDTFDNECKAAQSLVCKILEYISTPQYLRKSLFRKEPELRFVGILPPLRTPDHPLEYRMSKLKAGEHREGVVLSSRKDESLVDIGVESPLKIKSSLREGSRVTVRIIDPVMGIGEIAKRSEIGIYWGFRVSAFPSSLGSLLAQKKYDAVIATSKFGKNVVKIWGALSDLLTRSKDLLLVFGSSSEGVASILARENVNLEEAMDIVVNTVPLQGTATIRTEEAVIASLAVLNVMMEGMKLGS
ncbi:MAG: putative RNA uridine N3 methyltransferase [Thermoproteota archaeon]